MDEKKYNYYSSFGILHNNRKKQKNELLFNLYDKPKKDKGDNMPHYNQYPPDFFDEADLLFLPTDKGYKYALVVVDIGSKMVDAEPLKTKGGAELCKAFLKIYKRGIINRPKVLRTDAGSEFKGIVAKYLKDNDIKLQIAKPGRHRQVSIVERRNQMIGKAIFNRQTAEELLTGQPSTQWVSDLPTIVKLINFRTKKNHKKIKLSNDPVGDGNILYEGTKVRAIYDEPHDIGGKKLHGKFRTVDIRFNPKERIIEEVILKPNSPPLYILDGDKTVAYTKNQLQVIPKRENKPPSSIIQKNQQNKYIIEEIVGKKKIKGKIYYLVKWKGYTDKDNTYEPKEVLEEDVPQLIQDYEDNNK